MRDILSPTVTKNTVGMLRSYDTRTILILEGDSDCTTLARCIDRDECRLVIAQGKIEAIEAVEWSDVQGFAGVLAIVDSDLVDLVEVRSESSNVVYTDPYDLDSMVFFADGIVDRCVEAYCDYSRVHSDDSGEERIAFLKSKSLDMASLIGYLRLYSAIEGREITLDHFPFERAFEAEGLSPNIPALHLIVAKRCNGGPIQESELDGWIARMKSEVVPPARVAQGHDLFRCLAYAVKSTLGVSLRGDHWEKTARSHWRLEHLEKTQLYRRVAEWCRGSNRQVWLTIP
ncbi:hypothetical protein OG885_23880 [Streptomyces sp. NBC_00028]|uniref:hypothetical protein n=1 Tax=Streptomyces sp. NBC_00028 TaxID=2975624 RepID=UPI0032519BAA